MEITLSPKYGVNPTIPVCFWCGEEKNEVALLGHIGDGRKHEDFEAPMHMVLDYEPCDKCRANMSMGFTIMEATTRPNSTTNVPMQNGVYPTGRFAVIRTATARKMFHPDAMTMGKAFVDCALFNELIPNG